MASYTDQFGYLPIKETFSFAGGSVKPGQQFDVATAWMKAYAAKDGHVYPPHQPKEVEVSDGFLTVPVDDSGSPARLFRLPASHVLRLTDFTGTQEEARYGLAAFVMHFLGFLFGYRCHFHDWWIEGRVPTQSTADHSTSWRPEGEHALQSAVTTWKNWDDGLQLVALNAVFLHARAPQYYWSWERLQSEFMIMEAVAYIAENLDKIDKNLSHRARIPAMCEAFSLARDDARVERIVYLRNILMHQAVWDERMPGEHRSEDSWRAPYWLHNISKRVFLALCGIQGDYIRSDWWSITVHPFQIDV